MDLLLSCMVDPYKTYTTNYLKTFVDTRTWYPISKQSTLSSPIHIFKLLALDWIFQWLLRNESTVCYRMFLAKIGQCRIVPYVSSLAKSQCNYLETILLKRPRISIKFAHYKRDLSRARNRHDEWLNLRQNLLKIIYARIEISLLQIATKSSVCIISYNLNFLKPPEEQDYWFCMLKLDSTKDQ